MHGGTWITVTGANFHPFFKCAHVYSTRRYVPHIQRACHPRRLRVEHQRKIASLPSSKISIINADHPRGAE